MADRSPLVQTDLVAEVERALQQATPGKWELVLQFGALYFSSPEQNFSPEDADLIAGAPEWLRRLCARVRELEKERNAARGDQKIANDAGEHFANELVLLRRILMEPTDSEVDHIIALGEQWSRDTVHDLGEVSKRKMVRHLLRGALKLWETATFEELRALERHAPEWLGALVQAVEDQQREIAGLNDEVAMCRMLHENCCRERATLENEAVDHRGRKPILWRDPLGVIRYDHTRLAELSLGERQELARHFSTGD